MMLSDLQPGLVLDKLQLGYVEHYPVKIQHPANKNQVSRLSTVPYFFVRSFRYTAPYRHGYLDFQMYRGGGRRGL